MRLTAHRLSRQRLFAPQTEADRRLKKIEDTFYGRRNSTRDARK